MALTPRRIAVVGGGMAGLMAALRLRQVGAETTVFEAMAMPGGMIRTVHRDGWVLESGASTLTSTASIRAVLDEAAPLPAALRPAQGSQRRYLVHEGRVVPVPGSAAEFVATPLLSLAGRMRFMREPFVPRGEADADESMASFTRRRFGDEGAARIFDPLVSGTTGGDPEQLLARYTFPNEVEFERRAGSVLKGKMRAARTARREGNSREELAPWSCTGGLSALPEHVAASLGEHFRGSSRVSVVRFTNPGWTVVTDGGEDRFDGVIVALPAPALGQLHLEGPRAEALAHVASMPHASLVVLSLGFRRSDVPHPLDGHGLLAASSERRKILGVSFTSSQFPSHAPADHVLLTVSVGGARQPAAVALDDAALLDLVRAELHQLLGISASPKVVEIARWPAALPLAVAGHRERLAAADQLELAMPGLAFTGTWRDGLLLRDVMQGGIAAADRAAPSSATETG